VNRALARAGAVGLVVAAAVAMALTPDDLRDYRFDAGPPVRLLAAGDLAGFFTYQPLMGSFSVLLRVPIAALAGADASELAVYRAGIVPCLLAAGLLGLVLAGVVRRRGGGLGAQALTVALCLASPPAFASLAWGHPEEPLGAALAVGAVLAALRGRGAWAVVLLGLAIATKQWALVAVGPVLLAWPGSRARLAAGAGAVAAAFAVPLALARPDRFLDVLDQAAVARGVPSAVSAWWPFASPQELAGPDGLELTRYVLADWAYAVSRPAIVLLPLALALVLAVRRRERAAEGALALLALALLARCVLEPVDNEYYHAPFVAALCAWEVHARRGAPLLTLAATAALYVVFHRVAPLHDLALTNAAYLAWALPLAALLVREAWSPRAAPAPAALALSPRPSGPSGTR
jgi:hypothetical protein